MQAAKSNCLSRSTATHQRSICGLLSRTALHSASLVPVSSSDVFLYCIVRFMFFYLSRAPENGSEVPTINLTSDQKAVLEPTESA
jgi:hypothetical protein